MREEIENPMVIGDYYDSAPEPEYPEKLAYVLEKGLGYMAVAHGFNADEHTIDGIRDQFEKAFELFMEHNPETAREWVEHLLELDPYHDAFAEWRRDRRGLLYGFDTVIPRRDEEGHAVFPAGFDDDWGEYGKGKPA